MEWHVWGPTDKEPTIYNDPTVLQLALSQYNPNQLVLVRTYKRLEMGVQVYNGPDSIPLPPAPQKPPQTVITMIKHVKVIK